ncbi:hypothetical protein SUDANB6_03560 [Streptomyces sp. enrichment culture]|uniref:hypothetical protein n=1 Tax=Streptomyces sp. enrichment culture TaxID=1795815 RepID=UPI003F55E9E2
MRRTARASLCVIIAASAVALTACRSGQDETDGASASSAPPAASGAPSRQAFPGLSGPEIADRAVEATTGASSLRVKGDIPDDETGGTIRFDMALDKKGECAGTLGLDGGGRAELIRTGDTVYLRYDEAFLRAQAEGEPEAETDAAVAMLAGKWTKMRATGQDAEDFASFCDLDTVLGGVRDARPDSTRGKATTVDGTPAVVLHEKDGKDRFDLYVATEGKPYLLRVDSLTPGDSGSLTLGDYDEPVPATAPTGEVIDLDALSG